MKNIITNKLNAKEIANEAIKRLKTAGYKLSKEDIDYLIENVAPTMLEDCNCDPVDDEQLILYTMAVIENERAED